MRKKLVLIGVLLVVLSACGGKESTATPVDVSALQTAAVQTVFAGANQTATANAPTDTPVPTPTATCALTINGQLQGTLVFIRNYNLWVSINGVEVQLTTDAISTQLGSAQLWYSKPQISPDGTKIAYTKNISESVYSHTSTIMVSDVDGRNARELTNSSAILWSNDSQKIYYPVSNGYDTTTGLETIVIKSVNLTTGDLVDQGQYAVLIGCGGGSSDIADHISHNESIGRHTFALSSQNNYVIHSTTCTSGLGVLDFSINQDKMLDDGTVSAATISPDGLRIAAISGNNIVIFNAANGKIEQTVPTPESPRALLG